MVKRITWKSSSDLGVLMISWTLWYQTVTGLPVKDTARIISGTSVEEDTFPFILSLRQSNLTAPVCGASLIRSDDGSSSKFALTAAHCVCNPDGSHIEDRTVYAEEQITRLKSSVSRNIRDIICHPSYQTPHNDVAVLVLEEPLQFEEHKVAPIDLIDSDYDQGQLQGCRIAGWGVAEMSDDGSTVDPLELQELDILLRSDKRCKSGYDYYDREIEMCYSNMDGATCVGDSGSPIFCELGDRLVQVAVHSHHPSATCEIGSLAYGARIGYFSSWIRDVIKSHSDVVFAEILV